MRIRELEAEFSDEKIAEIFRMDDIEDVRIGEGGLTRAGVLRYVIRVGLALACIVILLQFFAPKIVMETSMENTLLPYDCVILASRAYAFSEIEFGDIVAVGSRAEGEGGEARDLIKRVIGLPGDVIELQGGGVFRNGEPINEPYIKDGITTGAAAPVTVPDGMYYVLGDNRQHSLDSRDASVGCVSKALIKGKAIFRILPVSRAGGIG